MAQTIKRNEVSSLKSLTEEDARVFDNNWKAAEKMVEQDQMAWIGTDSVIPRLNQNELNKLRGYVVRGNVSAGEVNYYSFNEDSTKKVHINSQHAAWVGKRKGHGNE